MAFDVFPNQPPGTPLRLRHDEASGFIDFTPLLTTFPEGEVTFVRLVKLGNGCDDPGGGHPRVRVGFEGGPSVEPLPPAAGQESGPAATLMLGDEKLAFAQYRVFDRGVRRVRLVLLPPALADERQWQLEIVNRDMEERGFAWVVADRDEEARKPWIDVQPVAPVTATAGDVVPLATKVLNLGTGELRLDLPDELDLGEGFALVSVAPTKVPPNGCADVKLRFTAPSLPGAGDAVYVADSNDPLQGKPGHRRRLALSATTRPRGVAVRVLGVAAERIQDFRDSIRDRHFATAMGIAVEPLRSLGTLEFMPESTTPTRPEAMQGIVDGLAPGFPNGMHSLVTYMTQAGDPSAGPTAVREGRRKALERATETVGSGPFSTVGAAALELPEAAFEIARAAGVGETHLMVVQLIPPMVLEEFETEGFDDQIVLTFIGSGFVLKAGDPVSVNFRARRPFNPGFEHPPEAFMRGPGETVGEATPTLVKSAIPMIRESAMVSVHISRSDGPEADAEFDHKFI
jgi:hypothetical protein